MRVATWNVNSLKVRLPHVLDFASLLVALAAALTAGVIWRGAVRHYRSAGG